MGVTAKKSKITVFFPSLLCLTFILGQFGRIEILGLTLYAHEVILFLSIFWYFTRIVQMELPVRKIFLPVIVFSLSIVASLFFSIQGKDNHEVFLAIAYLLRFLLYASLVLLVPLTGGIRTWVRSLVFSGTVFTLAGFVQFFLYPDLRNIAYLGWDPHYMRFVSTIFDPNIAGYMLISFLLITFLAFHTEQKYREILGVVLVSELIAIILTFSRSSIVTLGLIMIAYSVVRKIWWPILVAVGVGVVSVMVIPFGSYLSPMRIVSALARVDNFSNGVSLFLTSPFTGVGWFMIPAFQSAVETTKAYARLDNSFLFVLASTGLVGISAFFWLLTRISMLVWTGYRIVSQRSIVIILGLILLTLVVHSQFENIFFSAWGLMWLWVSVGLLFSLQEKKV